MHPPKHRRLNAQIELCTHTRTQTQKAGAGIATITWFPPVSIYHPTRPRYKCSWAGPGKNSQSGSQCKEEWENNNKWKVMTHHASVRFMSVYPTLLLSYTWRPGRRCSPYTSQRWWEESAVSNHGALSKKKKGEGMEPDLLGYGQWQNPTTEH